MKIILALLTVGLLGSSFSQAATIDFEEFLSGNGTGSIASQGYVLTASTNPNTNTDYTIGTISAGNTSGLSYGWCPDCTATLETSAGNPFSIFSAEILLFNLGPEGTLSVDITGYLAGGGTLETSISSESTEFEFKMLLFGPEWQGQVLEKIIFGLPSGPAGGSTAVRIDNIIVTAVPVPAAVWLFGSGLAGLAGFRRLVRSWGSQTQASLHS
jgi:hypothetical protein